MGIKYSFTDNSIYGTDDINEIAQCLTGSGIMPFLTKESYSVSDLNLVTAELVTSGTNLDGCKCTLINSGTADLQVEVSQGIIFFESGVRLIVDEYGYLVDALPNTAGWVYAHFNPSLQKADILFDAQLPTDGECVVLAKLSDMGLLTGERQIARSKVGTMGRNVSQTIDFTSIEPELHESGELESAYIVAKVEGVDLSNYNFAYITEGSTEENLYHAYYQSLFDIGTGTTMFRIRQYSEMDYDQRADGFLRPPISRYEGNRYIKVIEGELCIVVMSRPEYVQRGGINTYKYTAILS